MEIIKKLSSLQFATKKVKQKHTMCSGKVSISKARALIEWSRCMIWSTTENREKEGQGSTTMAEKSY